MLRYFSLLFICFFLFIKLGAQAPWQGISLPAGFRFNTETFINLIIEQEFMGIRYSTQMDVHTLMNERVKGMNPDSSYIISASYRKMDISVTSILINMEVNSESLTPGDSLSLLLRSMTDKEFTIILSRRGEILGITGLDSLITASAAAGSLAPQPQQEFAMNLVQSIGEEAVKDNYRSNSAFYPGRAVRPKDQWNYQTSIIKSGIPMMTDSRVRLKDLSRDLIFLTSEARLSALNSNGNAEGSPGYEIKGTEICEKKIDNNTGLILESVSSVNIEGMINTPSKESPEQTDQMPFSINSRCTIRCSRLK
jgi:hypothetical protein